MRHIRLYATRPATYCRVVVNGRVHPFTLSSVVNGDTLDVDLKYEAPEDAHVVWWEEGVTLPPEAALDYYARQLAESRPAE